MHLIIIALRRSTFGLQKRPRGSLSIIIKLHPHQKGYLKRHQLRQVASFRPGSAAITIGARRLGGFGRNLQKNISGTVA
jgi:hypothetical protein